MNSKRRMLLICDVEGTIFKANMQIGKEFASTVWHGLAKELDKISPGAEKEELETQIKWFRGEYSGYKEWIQAAIAIHKKYNLTKEIFDKVINNAEYMPAVKEFFSVLDREKFLPVFITGGFYELADRARRELMINDTPIYASCRYDFYDTGKHFVSNVTSFDWESKIDAVKIVVRDEGLDYNSDWIFIGDGQNDIRVAEEAPYSFGINAHPALNTSEKIEDFRDIIPKISELYSNPEPIIKRERLRKERFQESLQRMAKENEELRKRLETVGKPNSVKHIIPFFENYYEKYVYFGKKAEPSLLKDCQNFTEKQTHMLYEDLETIYNYALFEWFRTSTSPISKEVKNTSEGTLNKYGNEYKDCGLFARWHINISARPQDYRIYFAWDDKKRKVMISHIGKHLHTVENT